MLEPGDPYASQTQPRSLRVIQSEINPSYRAKNDTLEFNADYAVTPTLTLTSQTGYNKDFLYSTEDFNRFDTRPGIFGEGLRGNGDGLSPIVNGSYCDPQLGCSSAIVGEDLSQERACNSRRKCGWPPISAGRSISAPAAIICIIRRWRITTSSST
jgi:iron complex outermembrane receptor protein